MSSRIPDKGEQMVRYYGYYSNVCSVDSNCECPWKKMAGKSRHIGRELNGWFDERELEIEPQLLRQHPNLPEGWLRQLQAHIKPQGRPRKKAFTPFLKCSLMASFTLSGLRALRPARICS